MECPQMPDHGEKLTHKQEQTIAALLEYDTVRDAATACGMHERTVRC
jgi:hypothetical protein